MCQYWQEEAETTPNFNLIEEHYQFLLSQINQRNLTIPEHYREHPITRMERRNQEIEEGNQKFLDNDTSKYADRSSCPKCGSKHVVSNGACWMCRNCRKQWLKRD